MGTVAKRHICCQAVNLMSQLSPAPTLRPLCPPSPSVSLPLPLSPSLWKGIGPDQRFKQGYAEGEAAGWNAGIDEGLRAGYKKAKEELVAELSKSGEGYSLTMHEILIKLQRYKNAKEELAAALPKSESAEGYSLSIHEIKLQNYKNAKEVLAAELPKLKEEPANKKRKMDVSWDVWFQAAASAVNEQ